VTSLCGCGHLAQADVCEGHADMLASGGIVCEECRDKLPADERHDGCRSVVVDSGRLEIEGAR
jgi:hypothetical protein